MSIVLETRSTRSILTAVVQTLIKPFGDYLLKHDKPEPAGSKRLVPLSIATKRCKVVESFVADTWLYTFSQNREKATATPPERILYYFAGGGFRAPPAKEHWAMCAELCCRLPRYAIILVSYPLAPASPASSSLPHLFTLYENLESQAIADNVSITLMGDSAGGNVALVLAIHAAQRHVGHSMPPSMAEAQSPLRNVFVISPATDLRNTNPDIDAAAKKDPLLSKRSTSEVAEGWRGDWLLSDPRVSPNLADLSALALAGVKVDGIIGHSDTLAPDAIVFRKKLDRQGVTGDWLEWEKQMHCFPLMFMYHIFEGVQGVEWIAAVLSKNLSAQDSAKIAL